MKSVELSIAHQFDQGRGRVRATRVDLKVLAAYLNALADDPYNVETTVGAFELKIVVGRCSRCLGSGTIDARTACERPCDACEGTGKDGEK